MQFIEKIWKWSDASKVVYEVLYWRFSVEQFSVVVNNQCYMTFILKLISWLTYSETKCRNHFLFQISDQLWGSANSVNINICSSVGLNFSFEPGIDKLVYNINSNLCSTVRFNFYSVKSSIDNNLIINSVKFHISFIFLLKLWK